MTEFTSTTEYLPADEAETEAASVARVAARPASLPVPGSSDRAVIVACPEGWTAETYYPADEPVRPTFTRRTLTAAGFRSEIERLAGNRAPLILRAGGALIGHPEPTSIDAPTHDAVTVTLVPEVSDELEAWRKATNLTLDQWERHIEDCAVDIDAGEGPSSLDVLADARTWNVEVRRTVRRIKEANDDLEVASEIKAKSIGAVLQGFDIQVPILRHGAQVTLRVRIDRDIDNNRISARIPGLDRVIVAATEAEFAEAAAGWALVV